MTTFVRLPRSRLVLPLATLAAAAMLLVSEASNRHALASLDAVRAGIETRVGLLHTLRLLTDAESGQRGYLLTGRDEYLAPYEAARHALDGELGALALQYRDDAAMRPRLEALRALIAAKLSELAVTIARVRAGDRAGALDLVRTNIGKDEMDAIREAAAAINRVEDERYDAATRSVRDAIRISRVGVAIVTALSLLALATYLRQAAELDAARRARQQEIQTERDRLEQQVQRRTRQLTELARHLQAAREDERSRLARELHDELGAMFTAAKLDLARIRTRIAGLSPDATLRLAHLAETLNSGIALKRRIIEDLRPSSLSNLGLVAALEILLRDFEARSGVAINASLEPVAVTPDAELTIYRLVQEALTNVAKYARARRIDVTLARRAGGATVAVADDGVGFDPSATPLGAHGLMGMRYRVEGDGGALTLASTPGRGTRIEATLPARSAA